jgi:hypothetical protein
LLSGEGRGDQHVLALLILSIDTTGFVDEIRPPLFFRLSTFGRRSSLQRSPPLSLHFASLRQQHSQSRNIYSKETQNKLFNFHPFLSSACYLVRPLNFRVPII